ncbi:MAG: TolC family protein [Bacteroidales bacterium]|nr:TolC family protein [Bacteroidales bacterium]
MLKRIFIIVLFSLLSSIGIYAQKKEITLQECTALATQNYPAVVRYGLIEKVKEYNISNIEKSWLPRAGVTIKGSYQSHVTEIPISIPGMATDPLNKTQYSAVVAVNQTIWDGGVTTASKKEAQAKAISDVKELEIELYSIKERVNNIYFGVLLIDQYLKETEVLGRELDRMQNKVSALIASGVADSSDLYPVEAQKITLNQRFKELQNNKNSYLKVLSLMTGRASDTTATLLLPVLTKTTSQEILRPELSFFESKKEIAKIQSLYLNNRVLPKIGAFIQAGYGLPGLNMLKNEASGFYIGGITLSWSLDGFYTRKNDMRKIDAARASIESQKETFLYNARLKNASITSEIESIEELSITDQQLVAIREKIVESSSVKLENGATSVTEHLKEVNMLDAARLALGKRKIELLKAMSDLRNNLNQ